MLDRLMTDQRRTVSAGMILLVILTVCLWLVRGPRPLLSSIPFMAIGMLLIPVAYFGTYGILYLSVQFSHISIQSLRAICAVLFFVAALFLVCSAMFSISHFINHRPMPPPNFLVLGGALGSMKAWTLQSRSTEPR